jgi:hypothetical protein
MYRVVSSKMHSFSGNFDQLMNVKALGEVII